MPLIRIQERPSGPDGPNAIISFNNDPENPITINDPFEEHLEFPFTKKVRAQNAAASIKTYGEDLYKQVLAIQISMPNIETCSKLVCTICKSKLQAHRSFTRSTGNLLKTRS